MSSGGQEGGRVVPRTHTPADHTSRDALDALINWLFADPVLLGSYPEQMLPHLPDCYADDLPTIAAPLDFYGVNYYEPLGVAAPAPGNPLPFDLTPIDGYPLTTNGSPIVPAGLREFLLSLRHRMGAVVVVGSERALVRRVARGSITRCRVGRCG